MKRQLVLLMLIMFALAGIPATAQDSSDDAPAQIRVGHTLTNGPVQVFLDEQPLSRTLWDEVSFRPAWSYIYLEHPAGEYALRVVRRGDDPAEAPSQVVELVPGHRYSLVIYEMVAGEPVRYRWIDETATLGEHDPTKEGLSIFVNVIPDSPPLSVVMNGKTVVEGLEYAEYALGVDPAGPIERLQVVTADGEVLLDDAAFFGASMPGVFYTRMMQGWVTGEGDERSYTVIPALAPTYAGEITYTDGSPVVLDEPLHGEIAALGERVRHPLHLDEAASLDFQLDRTDEPTNEYSFLLHLRIYTAAGELLWEDPNDDRIRLRNVELAAGDYWVEVSHQDGIEVAAYELVVERD